MMIEEKMFREMLGHLSAEMGFFLVDVHFGDDGEIRIEADSDEGITIGECADLHKGLMSRLGNEGDNYRIRVSSPGLGRPFKVHRQYKKNIGRIIKVLKDDSTAVEGKLVSVDSDCITVERNRDKKKRHNSVQLDFAEIRDSRVIVK